MQILNVTTWTRNRRHLADLDTALHFDFGQWSVRTLCDRKATRAGYRVINETRDGGRTVEQDEIDALPVCATCLKKAEDGESGAQVGSS